MRAASAHLRLAHSSRRPSAQTESPASSTTTSPTVTSRPGIWTTCPSRSTLAVGADICLRLSREAAAFTVCTVPRMAFMVMTARMTMVLSSSPVKADTMAARIRMMTIKSANCSRKIRRVLFFPPSWSSFGPYLACRSAAWAEVRPSSPQSRSRNSSTRLFCQISLLIARSPFRQDTKKRGFCANAFALIQKSRRFNPKRGHARTDAVGYTCRCASYSLLVLRALYLIFPRLSTGNPGKFFIPSAGTDIRSP